MRASIKAVVAGQHMKRILKGLRTERLVLNMVSCTTKWRPGQVTQSQSERERARALLA